jgi:hypothetical protein
MPSANALVKRKGTNALDHHEDNSGYAVRMLAPAPAYAIPMICAVAGMEKQNPQGLALVIWGLRHRTDSEPAKLRHVALHSRSIVILRDAHACFA